MKFFICSLLILLSLFSQGQSINEIKQLLANKDFKAFEKYIDTAKSNKNIQITRQLQRDITPDFQEIFVLVYEDPIVKNERKNETGMYLFSIVATGVKIAFADFEKFSDGAAGDNKFQPHSSNKILDLTLMDSLYTSFLRLYHSNLNMQDLFDGTKIYGSRCNDGGLRPKGRIELDEILKQKNYTSLNEWLQSANVEKQVYAIDGLYQLKNRGYIITPLQENLIALIRNKKGNVKTCQGCVISSEPISDVVEKITRK